LVRYFLSFPSFSAMTHFTHSRRAFSLPSFCIFTFRVFGLSA
jgi:hypothetical protein